MTLLPINQFAKQSGVTSETLRYYDRIQLLSPHSQNEHGVRFYHVAQYEKLSTIKDLKSLGMSLTAIRDFFEDRNLDSSFQLIEKQLDLVRKKQRELALLEKKLVQRHQFLAQARVQEYSEKVEKKELGQQAFVQLGLPFQNEFDLYQAVMQLEKELDLEKEFAIFGLPRYALLFQGQDQVGELLFAVEEVNRKQLYLRDQGCYYTCYFTGHILDKALALAAIREQAAQDGQILSSDYLVVTRMDDSLTDQRQERLYEVQVKMIKN